MWSKMFPTFLCFLLMHSVFDVYGQEPLCPLCNKFSFEEQLLEKMVRMEIKVENMFAGMTKTQSEMQDMASKVDIQLAGMTKTQSEMQDMASKVDIQLAGMTKTQSEMQDMASKVDIQLKLLSKDRNDLTSKMDIELNLLSKDREIIRSDITVHKADTTKTLIDAAKEMENSVNDFERKIIRLSGDLKNFKNSTPNILNEQAVTYIRWGRTICPNESKIVYEGFAGGSHFNNPGGLSKTICLPREPQFRKKRAGEDGNYIYDAEYQDASRTRSVFGEDMHHQKVTCVVCEASRKSAVLMIPARKECYEGWNIEYTGYLMTSHTSHKRANAKCVDANPEKGRSGSTNSELFYLVEAGGDILDPPYTKGAELTCVVCTK